MHIHTYTHMYTNTSIHTCIIAYVHTHTHTHISKAVHIVRLQIKAKTSGQLILWFLSLTSHGTERYFWQEILKYKSIGDASVVFYSKQVLKTRFIQ